MAINGTVLLNSLQQCVRDLLMPRPMRSERSRPSVFTGRSRSYGSSDGNYCTTAWLACPDNSRKKKKKTCPDKETQAGRCWSSAASQLALCRRLPPRTREVMTLSIVCPVPILLSVSA